MVGVPEQHVGEIDAPLAKQPGTGGEKMHVDMEGGQPAKTRYRVVERAGNRAHLELVADEHVHQRQQIQHLRPSARLVRLRDDRGGGAVVARARHSSMERGDESDE